MSDTPEINESPEKQITKTPEKKIDTFDDLKASDNSGRINTFDDLKGQSSDKSIDTFDDLRKEAESSGIKAGSKLGESERLSNSSTKLSVDEGRHRTYVAAKEGYDNVPVKLNDVYTQKDGKTMIDRRDITHVNFDKDVLNSEDMQNMMKEHDFKKWEQGIAEHKGYKYSDHVKEFDRLKECQEAIKNGHSPSEIEGLLGKEHADTYKRFYETKPIQIDRVIEMD
jgi:hypothetical protein